MQSASTGYVSVIKVTIMKLIVKLMIKNRDSAREHYAIDYFSDSCK